MQVVVVDGVELLAELLVQAAVLTQTLQVAALQHLIMELQTQVVEVVELEIYREHLFIQLAVQVLLL